ncbi:MAG: DUF4340 domain-containing protein [Lachnospiraceae bacterium]|nr:DUF4340 domain-containing protein [Lachnospiraceae bacterium]
MEKKLVKLIIGGLAAVVVLVAALIVVNSISVNRDSGVKVFVDKAPEEITELYVANTTGGYKIYAEDDGYVFDDMPANIVDQEGFFELMNHSCAFGSLRTVEEDAADLSIYGLDNPTAMVKVIFNDGKEFNLSLGDKERVSGNYYGMVEDDKNVYLFAEEDVLYFYLRKQDYISTVVTPELMVSSPLSAVRDVTFSGTALEKPITIEAVTADKPDVALAAKSFGPATHIVKIKGTYELDQSYGIEMLGSLLGIHATDVVAYNVSDDDYSLLGFDNPYMQVDFSLKNGTDYIADYQLKLVPYGNQFMASMLGSGIIFLIDPPSFVSIDYTKLCMRWFLAPMRSDLESLTVEFDGQSFVYTSGSVDKEIWTKVNGQEMDPELFFSFYRLVTSAAADGKYLEDTVNEGEPLMTITYKYADGTKQPDVMKLYPGSVRRVNVEVNGITEFDMKESFVETMKNACYNSVAGLPIEENWQ